MATYLSESEIDLPESEIRSPGSQSDLQKSGIQPVGRDINRPESRTRSQGSDFGLQERETHPARSDFDRQECETRAPGSGADRRESGIRDPSLYAIMPAVRSSGPTDHAATAMMPRPLSALLSQVLVAFTVELDNEFERDRRGRTSGRPAVVDGVAEPVAFVPDEGRSVGDLVTESLLEPTQIKLMLGCRSGGVSSRCSAARPAKPLARRSVAPRAIASFATASAADAASRPRRSFARRRREARWRRRSGHRCPR
jgi:hypothetical protein